MKVKYTCEECGREYSTEAEAISCEEKHKEDARKASELKRNKSARSKEISEKISSFYNDYGELPDIEIHSDDVVIKSCNSGDLFSILKMIDDFC